MKRNLLLLLAVFLTAVGYAQINSVALVGAATPWGWPPYPGDDPGQLTQIDADNWQIVDVTLTAGPVKLRANNVWGGAGLEWAGAFPTAVGTSSGDIIVPVGGVYTVTLNTATNVYNFTGGVPISVVKLVGTATGVPLPDGLTMTTADAVTYTLTNVTLLDGTAQFEIDGASSGGDTFPAGDGTNPALFIPVVAGEYSSVTINIGDGQYLFTAAPVFPSIAIVGSGAGGWPVDPQVDANQLTTTDGITYTGTVTLTAWDGVVGSGTGEIKFRSNNNWTDPNWGGVTFPTGPDAGNPGGNIVVTTAGTYDVTFDSTTGAYSFTIPTIAIVGSGTAEGWPVDPQIDPNTFSTTDGRIYTINSITLVDAPAVADEVKLRANNGWGTNWGGITFPSGVATLGGGNILITPGTYGVTFDRVSGELNFGAPLATTSFKASNFRVYPNPTHNVWNFTSASQNIDSINIIDVLGKTVMTVSPKNISVAVDASGLNTGIYFARIATANSNTTVKLVKN